MKYFWVFLFCVATQVVDLAQSENILVISFFSSKSHKITYLPLLEELGKRGHNITIVSPIKPLKPMKNVKEILTIDVEKIFLDGKKFDAFDMKSKGAKMNPMQMLSMVHDTCSMTLDLPLIKDLLKEKVDLVFFPPMFNDCILAIIYRLQVPFVMFTPMPVPAFINNKMGGFFPPSITPNMMLGYPPEMDFQQRFLNFGADMLAYGFLKFWFEPKLEKLYREKLGEDIPSITELYENASLVLSNGHFSLSGPKAYYPDVVDVGGIHSRPAKPIPKDLEDFITKGKDGFILFSMGSAIKGDMMPESKRKLILNVFSKLKQQILWKWESESMPDLPKNVKLSKWLPQQDLLGRADIKMFITHCGGGSTEEAIYHGVPLLGMPMLADQPQNARTAKQKGFLVDLNWNELTEESFLGAINEILNNPKYRNNVKQLSTLFKDRPQDPLETGVYWVEYVLRHKGAPHLRNVGRKLNVLQYHSIDVISAYLALITTALYIIYSILRFVFRLCCSSQTNKYDLLAKGKKMN